jgi:hypothetical protein
MPHKSYGHPQARLLSKREAETQERETKRIFSYHHAFRTTHQLTLGVNLCTQGIAPYWGVQKSINGPLAATLESSVES